MALETATYIDALVTSNPDGTDARNTADDHLRLIKASIKRSLPMVAGAVSASHQAITYVNDLNAPIQAQINSLREGSATANNAVNARYANSASVAANIGTIPAARVADLNATNILLASEALRLANSSGYISWYNTAGDVRTGYIQMISGAAAYIAAEANIPLNFITNNLTRMIIAADGSVTIAGHQVLTDASVLNPTQLNSVAASDYARLSQPQSFAAGQAITQVNSSGASLTPNCDQGTMFRHVLTSNGVISAPVAARSGMVITIHLAQGGSGGFTVTWSSIYKFPGNSAPVLSTTSSFFDVFAFQYDSSSGVWRQAGLGLAA